MPVSPDTELHGLRCDVRVLGPCEIAINGVSADVRSWPRKGASLLRMLALAPDYALSRDEVIERLWPETSPEAGSSSLKNLIYRMRRITGDGGLPALLLLERGQVLLNPEYRWEVDAVQFLTHSGTSNEDVQSLETAAMLYRGEPLQEDCYYDWVVPYRLRLQAAFRALALRLAALYRSQHSEGKIVPLMERCLELDPFDEEALCTLLSALTVTGRQAMALRRYDDFAERLAREIDAAPTPETARLIEDIRENGATAHFAGVPSNSGSQAHAAITLLPLEIEPASSRPHAVDPTLAGTEEPVLRRAWQWGALTLLAASVITVLALMWWPQTSYGRQTPEGTVATYFQLLQDGRVDDAFALTSLSGTEPARLQFHRIFDGWGKQAHRVTLVHTVLGRHVARVAVELTTFNGDVLGGTDMVEQQTVMLTQRDGTWHVIAPSSPTM